MKTYTINLDAELYALLYMGIMVSEAHLNRKELRVISKLSDILEALGTRQENGFFILNGTKAEMTLDKFELNTLNKTVDSVNWKPIAARKVSRLFDILEGEVDSDA